MTKRWTLVAQYHGKALQKCSRTLWSRSREVGPVEIVTSRRLDQRMRGATWRGTSRPSISLAWSSTVHIADKTFHQEILLHAMLWGCIKCDHLALIVNVNVGNVHIVLHAINTIDKKEMNTHYLTSLRWILTLSKTLLLCETDMLWTIWAANYACFVELLWSDIFMIPILSDSNKPIWFLTARLDPVLQAKTRRTRALPFFFFFFLEVFTEVELVQHVTKMKSTQKAKQVIHFPKSFKG